LGSNAVRLKSAEFVVRLKSAKFKVRVAKLAIAEFIVAKLAIAKFKVKFKAAR